MPHTSPLSINHIPINPEWAKSLVGLRLIIPNRLWPTYNNSHLNPGQIVSINFNKLWAYYFEVQLGSHNHCYGMLYESVLTYIDMEQPGFIRYCLPNSVRAIRMTRWCESPCHDIINQISWLSSQDPPPACLWGWALMRICEWCSRQWWWHRWWQQQLWWIWEDQTTMMTKRAMKTKKGEEDDDKDNDKEEEGAGNHTQQ